MNHLSLGVLMAILIAVIAGSRAAVASESGECRVMESRNSYLGFANSNGMTRVAVARYANPFDKIAASTSPAQIERARIYMMSMLEQMGIENTPVSEVPERTLTVAREEIGIMLLRAGKFVDYALIYGSARFKSNGSLSLAYEEVNLKSGIRATRVLLVGRNRAADLLARFCHGGRCDAQQVLNEPARYQNAIKAILGGEIALKLKGCN